MFHIINDSADSFNYIQQFAKLQLTEMFLA